MQFLGWTIDVARDQSPTDEWLNSTLQSSLDAGYNAVGLYLEHRYAYPSAPWAAAPGCLTPDRVRKLVDRFAAQKLRVIPFLNTLGHMEGFIRAEGGQWLAEGSRAGSLQICPSRPECADFARNLVTDILDVFDDEWVHIGGDEAWQLGQCPLCAERMKSIGPTGLYGEYYGPLCRWLLDQGRRPCLWGDMLIKHPDALDHIPKQTLIFDWQYFNRPRESTRMFRERGYDVVCCPSIQSYNSAWCFLEATRQNIDQHAEDARELGALGLLVTTWEFSYFTSYAATLPVILSAARRLGRGEGWKEALAQATTRQFGEDYVKAAEILGNQIPAASPFLNEGTWRRLRDQFVIRQNPFNLWRHWRDACGVEGTAVLQLCEHAADLLPPADESEACSQLRFPILLHRVAVEWVRLVELAYQHYARRDISACTDVLKAGIPLLTQLRPDLRRNAAAGGSSADIGRLDLLIQKVETVLTRLHTLRAVSPNSPTAPPYLPAFEMLIHDGYIPNDHAGWRAADNPDPPRPA